MTAAEVTVDPEEPNVLVRILMTHNRAIDDFLADCRARGWSERTLTTYAATLNRFTDRLPVDQDVSKTGIEDIRRYRASRQKTVARNTLAGEEAHLASYFGWLTRNRLIARDPVQLLDRTRRIQPDDLEVKTLTPDDVRKLFAAARPGAERNALAILAYLGARRHAVAMLKLADYDRARGLMRFREKGAKIAWRPVPNELAEILNASIERGDVQPAPHDYLVPSEGPLWRGGDRDDRVVWRLVKRIAGRAGVDCHVHAIRAAFACFYLDCYPDDLLGLKDQLGHTSVNTTMIYLRRRNKETGMERVRDFSWDRGNEDRVVEPSSPNTVGDDARVGAGGFEPPESFLSAPTDASHPTSANLPFEVVVLSAEEGRIEEARVAVAARGISDPLGFRLAGLTDGEGHFAITKVGNGWRCHFVIKLRVDDRPLLDELCAATELGKVRVEASPSRYHPCARWEVQTKKDCLALADVFRVYPLRSKKARDAAIWMDAVDEWQLIYRNEKADWSRIAELGRAIRAVRQFSLTRDDLALLDALPDAEVSEAVTPDKERDH